MRAAERDNTCGELQLIKFMLRVDLLRQKAVILASKQVFAVVKANRPIQGDRLHEQTYI